MGSMQTGVIHGTTYWFSNMPAEAGISTGLTTAHGIVWYRDGAAYMASWNDPPEAIVKQAVDLAHRQQWDELAVLVKLMQAL